MKTKKIKSTSKSIHNFVVSLMLATMLVACGGSSNSNDDSSGDESVSLTGTAATGAPFSGTISTRDSTGENVDNVTIQADGTFTVSVVAANFPLMIKAVPDVSGEPLYSYITAADVNPGGDTANVNITPLTSLALHLATGGTDLATLFDNWASNTGSITEAKLTDAQAVINATLSAQFLANGIDPTNYDFFSETFSANSTGIDAVLDLVQVDLSSGVDVSVNGPSGFAFDEQIDTTGFNIGGEAVTYTVGGTVANATGTLALQNNGGDDLAVNDNAFTFASGLPDDSPYQVTVLTHPNGQSCTVASGSGVIAGANVTDVAVTCSAIGGGATYTVGGAVAGLSGTLSLDLLVNSSNTESLQVTQNGNFVFAETSDSGNTYEVQVNSQPNGQTCNLANESGTISDADITNVSITCTDNSNANLTTGSATLNVAPTANYFDFETGSNLATNDTRAGDIFGVANEGNNFGNELATNITGRRLYLLASSGSLDSIPSVPLRTDTAPWVAVSYDFSDGTGGSPISVGELWVVYTSASNYAVMEITSVTGNGFPSGSGSFTFDYVLNEDGTTDF